MGVQKKKSTPLFLILSLLTLFLVPCSYSSEPLPGPSVIDIAAFEGTKRFGNQSTAHFINTFYDLKGTPAVHLFLVTKDQESIPEDMDKCIEGGRRLLEEGESLIRTGKTEEGQRLIASGKTLLLQEDRYGALLVSARQGGPSLIAFHHGLPTYLAAKKEVDERVTPLGVLYFSPLEYYFEFEIEDQKTLVNAFSLKFLSRAELEKDLRSSSLTYLEEQDGDASDLTQSDLYDLKGRNHTGADPLGQTSDYQFIPGVPDYHQPAKFPDSCGPTAGACLLGYWDGQGFEDLLQGPGNYDDVTGLIEELCGTMDWNPSSGVYYSQIPVGLRHVIDDRGYEIGISSLYGIGSLDIVRQEIIEGRPFIYGSQENPWGTPHYVVVVGYQENFIIVHDNWQSTPVDYFVNWAALEHSDDMMTTLVPEGQVGPVNEPLPSDRGGGSGGCFIASTIHR